MYTAYIKTPKIKSIIENDKSCEEKLSELRTLVGLDPVEVNTLESPQVEPDIHDTLLAGLNENEKKLAREVLNLIDASTFLSYDKQNFELIINGKAVKFSNIKFL